MRTMVLMEIKIQHPRLGAALIVDLATYQAVAGPSAALIGTNEFGPVLLAPVGSRLARRLMMEGALEFAEKQDGGVTPKT